MVVTLRGADFYLCFLPQAQSRPTEVLVARDGFLHTKEALISDPLFLEPVESDKSAVFACKCHCEEDGAFKPEFIRAVAQQLIRDAIGNSVGGSVLKVYKGVGRQT
jgi:hypothetical protein